MAGLRRAADLFAGVEKDGIEEEGGLVPPSKCEASERDRGQDLRRKEAPCCVRDRDGGGGGSWARDGQGGS